MNNPTSDIFLLLPLLERYHQNCLSVLAATGMWVKMCICCLGLPHHFFWLGSQDISFFPYIFVLISRFI